MVINLPILKDHEMAGITFSMKNMYGVVDRPFLLHPNNCNPGVADVNAIPAVRAKVWFTVGDAISSVYDGGPGFRPDRAPARRSGSANARSSGTQARLHCHGGRRGAPAGDK